MKEEINDVTWNEFEYGNRNYYDEAGQDFERKNTKKITKKRKWKEIENIKENRRLKEEISSFEYYSF